MIKKIFLTVIMISVAAINGDCETLFLKSGEVVQGRIVRESEHYVMFQRDATRQVDGFLKENILKVSAQNIPAEPPELTAVETIEPSKAPVQEEGPQKSNVLRIYGTSILEENESMPESESSSESTLFYVNKNISASEDLLAQWANKEGQASPLMGVGIILGFLLLYVVSCLPFYLIARKTLTPHAYFAWIPLFNIYLLCKIADRPGWWLLLLFLPLVNIVIITIIWMDIAAVCGKPSWIGLLILVPVASFFMIWYLALSKMDATVERKGAEVSLIDEDEEADAKEKELYNQIVPTDNSNKPKRF